MRCKQAKILINEYLDGTLGPEKTAELLLHIKSCKDCSNELNDLKALKTALELLPQEDPPQGLLSGAIKKAKFESPNPVKKPVPYKRYAAIAAAAVITIGVVWYLNTGMQNYAGAAEPSAEMKMFAAEAPAASSSAAASASAAPAESAAPQASAAAGMEAPAALSGSSSITAAESAPVEGAAEQATLKGANDESIADGQKIQLPEVEIQIETKKTESFYTDFIAFTKEYHLMIELYQENNMETASFVLEEALKPAFNELLKKHGLDEVDEVKAPSLPATIHVVFIKA